MQDFHWPTSHKWERTKGAARLKQGEIESKSFCNFWHKRDACADPAFETLSFTISTVS